MRPVPTQESTTQHGMREIRNSDLNARAVQDHRAANAISTWGSSVSIVTRLLAG